MMPDDGILLVFTRQPVPGKTKTRLIPVLGYEGAAALHRRLLKRTLATAVASDYPHVEIHAYPDTNEVSLQEMAQDYSLTIHCQSGDDLGQRMFNALKTSLARHPFAVIIGSDCPLLSIEILNRSYRLLAHREADGVIGPSEDGGYYLIGMHTAEKSLFESIEWGNSAVYDQTRAILEQRDLSFSTLNLLWDVDVPADFARLERSAQFVDLLY